MEEEVPQVKPAASKKKREDKSRRRDPKAWENVLKSISTLSDEQKIDAIAEKYEDLYIVNRHYYQTNQALEKRINILQKEHDHVQSELAKSVVAKARLENLCRELQKQNKLVKDESYARLKEEEDRRKEVSSRFSEKLQAITQMMEDNKEKSTKLRDENIKVNNKFTELYEQVKAREENITQMTKQMELAKHLSEAHIARLTLEFNKERETWDKQRRVLELALEKSEANCALLSENIKTLKENVAVYKNQYSDFESTMTKSNKVFDNFKNEMSKMSKQIISLEKESHDWKKRWESSAGTLIQLSDLNLSQEGELRASSRKIELLEKLSRQLQAERSSYLKLLKAHGIDPKVDDDNNKTETPAPIKTEKGQELEILKMNLKVLQELTAVCDSITPKDKAEQNGEVQQTETESKPEAAETEAVKPETTD